MSLIRSEVSTGLTGFVIKSNSLIEARYRLTLQESKIILWLLTQIKPDDEDFKAHRLDIAEFAKLLNVDIDSKYRELRSITRHLIQRIIEIKDTEKDRIIQISWLSSAIYEIKKGYVTLKFDPELKPYLLQLKSHFTKIDIVDILKLKSIYAVRIFELLLQYISIGSRTISIDDLRSYCGIEELKYKDYFDLKRYAIKKAKTEINTKTEYNIDYREIKESRKIAAIEWTICKKDLDKQKHKERLNILTKEMRSQHAIIDSLREYGFGKITAKRLLVLHGEETVANAIRAVNIQVEKGKVKNPKAMMKVAIEERWHPEIYKFKKIKP